VSALRAALFTMFMAQENTLLRRARTVQSHQNVYAQY